MPETREPLQVLIANERDERLDRITAIVERLGHEISASSLDVGEVGPLRRSVGADVALVGFGLDSAHALELVSSIVQEAACPVIALVDAEEPGYVSEAAKRGIFAYVIMDGDEAELRNVLDITLRRFAEVSNLLGFGEFANPMAAHVGYDDDDRVIGLITRGIGQPETAPVVQERCSWQEVGEDLR